MTVARCKLFDTLVSRLPRIALGAVMLLVAAVLPACRPDQSASAPAAASQPAVPVPVVLTTPKDAARSVLTCLQAQRAARVRHDNEAVAACQEQLRAMAARDVILRRYESLGRGPADDPDELLDRFIQGWGPIIGYYADGLQLGQIKTRGPLVGVQQIDVYVWATSDRGDAVLRLECFRGGDDQWRVARLDFAHPGPPQASSAPTP